MRDRARRDTAGTCPGRWRPRGDQGRGLHGAEGRRPRIPSILARAGPPERRLQESGAHQTRRHAPAGPAPAPAQGCPHGLAGQGPPAAAWPGNNLRPPGPGPPLADRGPGHPETTPPAHISHHLSSRMRNSGRPEIQQPSGGVWAGSSPAAEWGPKPCDPQEGLGKPRGSPGSGAAGLSHGHGPGALCQQSPVRLGRQQQRPTSPVTVRQWRLLRDIRGPAAPSCSSVAGGGIELYFIF